MICFANSKGKYTVVILLVRPSKERTKEKGKNETEALAGGPAGMSEANRVPATPTVAP